MNFGKNSDIGKIKDWIEISEFRILVDCSFLVILVQICRLLKICCCKQFTQNKKNQIKDTSSARGCLIF